MLEVPDGQYPQLVKFQAVQERCALLDNFSEGDRVKVSFDLRGREWQGKYLTNLNAWRIEAAGAAENTPPAPDERFPAEPFPDYTNTPPPANMDDLPF